jgi:hypothetical protein
MKNTNLLKYGVFGVGVVLVLFVATRFALLNLGVSTSSTMMGNSEGFALGMADSSAPSFAAAPSLRMAKQAAPMMAGDVGGQGGQVNGESRLIIKTGNLSLVVKDVAASIAKIQEFAKTKGGFVVSSNISKNGLSPNGEVTIRIPSEIFDGGVAELKALGEVKSEQVNGQDITEEFADLNAQLRNLKVTEMQLLEIMKKAQRIEDILSVQRELTNLQGQIEVLQGRIKYLDQSAKLSTLTVYLATDAQNLPLVDSQEKWKPLAEIKNALRSLLDVGKGIVSLVIWFVVYIPLWLVIGSVVWFVLRAWKKQSSKN